MSYIETIQKYLKDALEFPRISIGKVDANNDVLYIRQTGSKGYNYLRSFQSNNYYQSKFQILIYINDLSAAFEMSDKIEMVLENSKEINMDDKTIVRFEKISGPIDMGFDAQDRKIISLNYTVDFRLNGVGENG